MQSLYRRHIILYVVGIAYVSYVVEMVHKDWVFYAIHSSRTQTRSYPKQIAFSFRKKTRTNSIVETFPSFPVGSVVMIQTQIAEKNNPNNISSLIQL